MAIGNIRRPANLGLAAAGLLAGLLVPLVAAAPAHAAGTVTVTVTGSGTVTGVGINCTGTGGPDCSQFYADDVEQVCDPELKPPCRDIAIDPTVDLTAAPGNNGFAFNGWTGCDTATQGTCTLTVDGPAAVTARYLDVQAPQQPALTPYNKHVRGTVFVSAATADNTGNVARVVFKVPGSPDVEDLTAPFAVPVDTTAATDGDLTVSARAYDATGNTSAPGSTTLHVDNTAPTATIDSGPSGPVRAGSSHTWAFSLADQGTSGLGSVACSVVPDGNDASWGECSSWTDHTVSDLAEGDYTFAVRVRDGVGNETHRQRSFTIDGTAPTTSIVRGPKRVIQTARKRAVARFAFASDEAGVHYQCRLDRGRFRACSTTPRFRVTPGRHVLKVRAVDTAGNPDAAPALHRWKVVRRR